MCTPTLQSSHVLLRHPDGLQLTAATTPLPLRPPPHPRTVAALLMCRFAAPLAFNFMAAIALPQAKGQHEAAVRHQSLYFVSGGGVCLCVQQSGSGAAAALLPQAKGQHSAPARGWSVVLGV